MPFTRSQLIDLEKFVTTTFRCLQAAGIQYCVLRNHEGLPHRNDAADIDLLVHRADLEAAVRCIDSVEGAVVTGRVVRAAATHVFVAGVEWDGHEAVQVDFMTGVVWKGLPYLPTSDVLSRSRAGPPGRELIRTPAEVDEAVISLMSSLVVGGRIKERYQHLVTRVFAEQPEAAAAVLEPSFGGSTSRRLIAAVASGTPAEVVAVAPSLRRQLVMRSLRSQPAAAPLSIARHYRREAEIRWSSRYTDDVYLSGGSAAGRVEFAGELAGAIAHMAKEIHIRPVTPGWRGAVARAVRRRIPDVRNRAVRLWPDLPPQAGPGLVLIIGPGKPPSAGAGTLVTLPDDPGERLRCAGAAVRDYLATRTSAS